MELKERAVRGDELNRTPDAEKKKEEQVKLVKKAFDIFVPKHPTI